MDANAGQKDGTLRKIIDMCEEKYGHYRQILDDLVDEVLDSEEEGDDFSHRLPRNIDQVLVPSKKGDKLRPLYDMTGNGSPSYRHRPASEMLYAMIEADGQRTRWKMIRGSSRNITS